MIRDGEHRSILAENVVIGDIIVLKGGDRVPADIRVVEAHGFKVRALSSACQTLVHGRSLSLLFLQSFLQPCKLTVQSGQSPTLRTLTIVHGTALFSVINSLKHHLSILLFNCLGLLCDRHKFIGQFTQAFEYFSVV